MNGAHLHLLFNHLPVVASLVALPLLALAVWRSHRFRVLERSGGADRGLAAARAARAASVQAAVLVLVIAAAGGLGALWTGEPAEDVVRELPGSHQELIHEHEERADLAAASSGLTGLAALALAWVERRREHELRRALAVVAVGALASAGAMAWTAAAGGRINHPEIRSAEPAP